MRVGSSRMAATMSCSPWVAGTRPCSRCGRNTLAAVSSRRRRPRAAASTHRRSRHSALGLRTPLDVGRTLARMQLVRRWRADLAKPPIPPKRDERIFLMCSAVAIVVVAQLFDGGSGRALLLLVPAVVAFGLPRLPAEALAALVLVPVVLVVGSKGALEGTFFLTVMMVYATSTHLGSLTRALIIAAGA